MAPTEQNLPRSVRRTHRSVLQTPVGNYRLKLDKLQVKQREFQNAIDTIVSQDADARDQIRRYIAESNCKSQIQHLKKINRAIARISSQILRDIEDNKKACQDLCDDIALTHNELANAGIQTNRIASEECRYNDVMNKLPKKIRYIARYFPSASKNVLITIDKDGTIMDYYAKKSWTFSKIILHCVALILDLWQRLLPIENSSQDEMDVP